ncbi:MAG: hypothetical protein JWR22_1870 [Herminiimonas sp.]|nr:hypothetical protein [Herminiimonas sp.]
MAQTEVIVTHTSLIAADDAARFVSASIREKLGESSPDALIVFVSPEYPYDDLLSALNDYCKPGILVGCSSAGEFSGRSTKNASISVMAIRSDSIRFNARCATGLRTDRSSAIQGILPVFTGSEHPEFPYRSALVLTDALAGYADEMIHVMTVETGGSYQLFGGGAADDARFHETHVFHGRRSYADAVVVLEMLSRKPIGLGVEHGWKPSGAPLRVTEADGNRLISLDATSVVEIFREHAERTGQTFNPADPLPFFLHNVIGIDTGDDHKLRVPLSLNEDGSVSCAAEVPVGATVHIMVASIESACDAARQASLAAIAGLRGEAHAGSLVFDCAATRLRLGRSFSDELVAVAEALGSENFAGCNTYGQIARGEGQFNGFHNCTAVVCAIPK